MCNLPLSEAYYITKKEREESIMRKPNKNTPYNPYGPATGIPSPDPHNEVLEEGTYYTGTSIPGTADHARPGHAEGGAGHDGCGHE